MQFKHICFFENKMFLKGEHKQILFFNGLQDEVFYKLFTMTCSVDFKLVVR